MRRKAELGKPVTMPIPIRALLPLAALLCLAPAAAQPAGQLVVQPGANPMAAIRADRWTEAETIAAQNRDPVARKLVTYFRLLAPGAATAVEITAFLADNPDWPNPPLLDRRRQEALAREPDDASAAALCARGEATLAPAMLRCATALRATGQPDQAAALALEAWVNVVTDPPHEEQFARDWAALPTPQDQWRRFQRLAWRDPIAANRQVARLAPTEAAVARARLALKGDDPAAPNFLAKLPKSVLSDPGFVLDHARFLRRKGDTFGAARLLIQETSSPDSTIGRAEFWAERHLLARRLLLEGGAEEAQNLVARHGQTNPEFVTEAEFLAGFIALRMLRDPVRATAHFTLLDQASKAAITQGRARYWLGRSAEVMGRDATEFYRQSAAWTTTFYGQMAALRLGEDLTTRANRVLSTRDPAWTNDSWLGLPAKDIYRAALWLIAWEEPARARPFFVRLDELTGPMPERAMQARAALNVGQPDAAVFIARRIGRDGGMIAESGWPMPYEPPSDFDAATALGVMRQESSFDPAAISPSGARGLMQLMPATAREVASKLGITTSQPALLSDLPHNMRLGTTYLRDMLTRFDHSAPLAIAAYNAGPHRVDRWLSDHGDPRVGQIAMLDWLERIPFNETRNYVQRVLENIVIYRAKRGEATETLDPAWLERR
jgi:soluble lytic murein transglycosylase